MKLHLIQTGPTPFADHVVVDHFPFTLGRSSGCDHQVFHPMVSRKHCEILDGEGKIVIQDLHSSNGTYLNGRRVKESSVVNDGDEINLACVSYRISLLPNPN